MALEKTLGVKLVERKRNELILPPEGREVAERSGTVLAEVAALTHLSHAKGEPFEGKLRLGASPTVGP